MMTELIRMDGKYQYRNGEPARLLCVDAAGSYPVWSMGQTSKAVQSHTACGKYSTAFADYKYDLIPVSPAPVMGPLDESDVIVGVTIIRSAGGGESLVIGKGRNGVVCPWNGDGLDVLTYDGIRDAAYSNDHGATWHRCEKEIVQ